jgi:protocatechuate 3,4-dioxygenase, beta subunit
MNGVGGQTSNRQAGNALHVNSERPCNYRVSFVKTKVMKYCIFIFLAILITQTGCSQKSAKPFPGNKPVATDVKAGGNCEGCEAVFECPVSFSELNETDTLPDFNEPGPKIEISGRIFKNDGKTPAAGVILYVYHTDQKGVYATRGGETGWGKRHGYIRGWVKSDANGNYRLYTLVPASYPNSRNPKHIHPTIKEPGVNAYWIDEFVFDDDPLLPASERNSSNPRGSNGVLKTEMRDGMLRATRDIVLGLNVPGYPADSK